MTPPYARRGGGSVVSLTGKVRGFLPGATDILAGGCRTKRGKLAVVYRKEMKANADS